MRPWNKRWAQRPSQTAEVFLAAFLLRIALVRWLGQDVGLGMNGLSTHCKPLGWGLHECSWVHMIFLHRDDSVRPDLVAEKVS